MRALIDAEVKRAVVDAATMLTGGLVPAEGALDEALDACPPGCSAGVLARALANYTVLTFVGTTRLMVATPNQELRVPDLLVDHLTPSR